MGALVLRSQKEPSHTGYLQALQSEQKIEWPVQLEMSNEFKYENGNYGTFGCASYGVNQYPTFVFDFLAFIKGTKTKNVSSFYGLDLGRPEGSRLFQ